MRGEHGGVSFRFPIQHRSTCDHVCSGVIRRVEPPVISIGVFSYLIVLLRALSDSYGHLGIARVLEHACACRDTLNLEDDWTKIHVEPSVHGMLSLLAPRVDVFAIAHEVHGEYVVIPALLARLVGVIDDASDGEGAAYVNFGDFMFGVGVREYDVVENAWKMSLDPKFSMFTTRFLTTGDDVHFVHLRTERRHDTLRSNDGFGE